MAYQDVIRAIKRDAKKVGRFAKGADDKYNEFMGAAGKYLVDTADSTVKGAVVDPARQVAATVTGNHAALRSAQHDSATDNEKGLGGQVLRNFIVRPAEEIAATATNRTVNNTTPFMQALAGPENADSIQKKTADTYTSFKKKGGAMGALAVPAAIGEAGLSIANDVPVVGGAFKAGEKLVEGGFKAAKFAKDASPAMKAAEQATGVARHHILNDDEAYALKGFSVDPNAKPTPEVRRLLDNAGIDHSDEVTLKDRVNQYLDRRDNFIDTHDSIAQGGYIGGPKAKGFDQATADNKVVTGTDGKPRFEADDSQATVRRLHPGYSDKLSSVLQHPTLYKDYPHLADVNVSVQDLPKGAKAVFSPEKNLIAVSAETAAHPQEFKSALLHETQHAIQNKEGFAAGTNLSDAAAYKANPGEIEARTVQDRMDMTPEQRAGTPLPDTQMPPTIPEKPNSDTLAQPELQPGKPVAPKGSYGEATDELLGRTKYGQEARDEANSAKGNSVREQLKEQFYDRFSPVNSFVRDIESMTKKKYRAEDDPYALMRLSQGLPDAINQRVQGIADVLKQAPDINSVKAVGMARQILSRAERGLSSTISPERAQQVIEEQRKLLGDEKFQQTADIVDEVGNYNKQMLHDLHDNGIISDAALEAIEETGGDYFSKMNILSKVLDNDQNRALFSRSGSFNTTKQSVKKVLAEASGHKEGEAVLDPVESLVLGTNNNMRLIAKNNVYKAFQRLSKEIPEFVVPIRDAAQVEEKISLASDNAALRPVRNKLIRIIKANKNGMRRLATQINQLEKKGLDLSLRKGGQRMANQEFDVGGLGGSRPTSQSGKATGAVDFTTDANGITTRGSDAGRITRLGKQRDDLRTKAESARLPEAAPEGTSMLRPASDFDKAAAAARDISNRAEGKQNDINDMFKAGRSGVNGEVTESKLGPKDTANFIRSLIEDGSQRDIDRIKKMVGTRDSRMLALLDKLTDIKAQYEDVATQVRANSDRTKDLADDKVPDGYSIITGYERGIESKLAVPKEVADVYTGKTPSQQDYLTSIVNKVNGFVKQNFTSNNPAFALITNPIRDAKSFAYNAKNVKGNPVDIGAALAKGFMARVLPGKMNPYEDMVDRWVAAGGKSGFYSDERAGEQLAKDINREVNGKRSAKSLGVKVVAVHNPKELAQEAGRVISAPFRVARDQLHNAASVLEDAPRVAQFMASVKAGKSDAEAALDARNVTVDFNQAGRVGQTVNAWVPFLNARGQGTIKSIQAIKRNPARAAAVYAALTATPIALAALNNNQHKDVLKMIPDQDRDNNFIIVLNDHKDAKGNFTGVIKIPKSDVDKTLGNPLEMVFRKMADDNPDSLQGIVTNLVGSLSPVDVVKDDKLNTSRAVGGVLPSFVKAPIETATNHNLYYDSALVPEGKQDLPDNDQVNPNTSRVAQFLGNVTGGSPIKIDNTLRNFTGSLLTEAPQDQLGGKLTGATASRMNTEFYKVLQTTKRERAEISQQVNQAITEGDVDTAQRLATSYNTYLVRQFTPFVHTYRAQLTPDLVQMYAKQPLTLTRRSISQRQRNILERQAAR